MARINVLQNGAHDINAELEIFSRFALLVAAYGWWRIVNYFTG